MKHFLNRCTLGASLSIGGSDFHAVDHEACTRQIFGRSISYAKYSRGFCVMASDIRERRSMSGDLGGTWRTVPPKFEVGDDPCIRLPNILRSSVIGCVWKYELSKERCHEGIFCSEIERIFLKKRSIYVIYHISDSKERQKTWKIRAMTKKRLSEVFGVEMDTSSWKRSFKHFSVPPKFGAKSPPMRTSYR